MELFCVLSTSFCKVDFLSTPFDDNSAELLNKLVKYFKLASADITNRPLLDKIANGGWDDVIETELKEACDEFSKI